MDERLLTWNFANWMTVILMVATGYMVIALGSRLVSMKTQKAA